jgi:predicted transcriptional regulator
LREVKIMADEPQLNSVELAAELTIAWLGNQNVRVLAEDVPAFLKAMHGTIQELSGGTSSTAIEVSPSEQSEHVPAVSVRRSLASKDHIISLIDGKPYRTLRRHLAGHGLTPEQYRERYNLKPDYPMTAPNYSEARRAMALKIGLGDKARAGRTPGRPAGTSDAGASSAPAADGKHARKPHQGRARRGRRSGSAQPQPAPTAAPAKSERARKARTSAD